LNWSSYKKINRLLGKALHDYEMIREGDRIAVGLSGGKDSLTLMWFLKERQYRVPVSYKIFAIYIDPGFEENFTDKLADYCKRLDYPLVVDYTDVGLKAHSMDNLENPCFLCSRLRRKRLYEIADQLGCNKLALAHNKDDVIETFFLNICYSGQISTMVPKQSVFNGKFHVIRPLAYTDESTIIRFAKGSDFPEFINPCPTATVSKRQEIKMLLNRLYRSNKKIKGNIFSAMSHVKTDYLLKRG
jgi:tRNA 2-thiocytidine biosynthesis protein TtcA